VRVKKAPMNVREIIANVKSLNLPEGSYIVYGSGPMAAAGIRESGDIDMLVNKKVFDRLKREGWQEINKGPNDKPLVRDIFEAHLHWEFSPYKPKLKHLLDTAREVNGVPFASLEEVRKWKAASGRPKDIVDIELINKHMRKHAGQ